MQIEYQGIVYDVAPDHPPYPPVQQIDGESFDMRSALCRGILLVRIQIEFKNDSITYSSMTRIEIRDFFFLGVIPDTDLDKILSTVRAWEEV